MKKLVILIFNLYLISSVYSQEINFDDSLFHPFVNIDSNSIWQIGQPQKSLFDSAYSPPYAIVTDTLANYPINDSSSFYLWQRHNNSSWWPTLNFYYKIDADSLNDFGRIEVSPDKGQSWVNVISESQDYYFDWHISIISNNQWVPKDSIPFTGSTQGWREFDLIMRGWNHFFSNTDSILFRVSFFSDSLETNQNGWLIDQIYMSHTISSINEVPANIKSQVYPNPSTDKITIEWENTNSQKFDLTICDVKGQIISERSNFNSSEITLNLSGLKSGIYFYKLTGENSEKQASGTFIKE